mmetsp:Transcript_64534/g.185584  ORF Transcript_64534/g.185584 Transcript_64534/m.185584 type:complete len:245 (-) Transcript_64534:157-891(-)
MPSTSASKGPYERAWPQRLWAQSAVRWPVPPSGASSQTSPPPASLAPASGPRWVRGARWPIGAQAPSTRPWPPPSLHRRPALANPSLAHPSRRCPSTSTCRTPDWPRLLSLHRLHRPRRRWCPRPSRQATALAGASQLGARRPRLRRRRPPRLPPLRPWRRRRHSMQEVQPRILLVPTRRRTNLSSPATTPSEIRGILHGPMRNLPHNSPPVARPGAARRTGRGRRGSGPACFGASRGSDREAP